MNLYLVRHGETAYNRDGLGLGRSDVPLSELGQRQAEAVGRAFREIPVDLVYTSPLQRAGDVAAAIAGHHGLTPQVDENLIEMDVGEMDGVPFPVVRERYPQLMRDWAGPDGHAAVFPGGESLLHVHERVAAFLDALHDRDEQHIVAVSHNFVIRLALCRLLGLPPGSFRRVIAGLASVSQARLDKRSVTVLRVNDVCHLSALNQP